MAKFLRTPFFKNMCERLLLEQSFTIFAKNSILDVWLGSVYASSDCSYSQIIGKKENTWPKQVVCYSSPPSKSNFKIKFYCWRQFVQTGTRFLGMKSKPSSHNWILVILKNGNYLYIHICINKSREIEINYKLKWYNNIYILKT